VIGSERRGRYSYGMRPLLIPLLLVSGILAVGGCGGDDDGSGEGGTAASETGGELFTQSSRKGTLTPIAGSEDTFKLTLSEAAPNVTVFTDRPARSASTEPLADFVDRWEQRGFAQDPPNAALVIDQEPDDADTAVFTLADPSHEATGSVTYTATHISGGTSSLPSDEDIDPPPSFGDSHLFIDPSTAGELHNFELDLSGRQGRHVKLTFDPPWTVTFAGDQQEVSYEVGPDVGGGELLASEVDLTSSGSVQFGIGGGTGPITGTATIPSGAGVTVSIDDGPDQPLKNGNFSLGG
jgi:hypothetical protein